VPEESTRALYHWRPEVGLLAGVENHRRKRCRPKRRRHGDEQPAHARDGERREEEIQAAPEIQGALPPLVLVAASMEDPASHLATSRCVWRTTLWSTTARATRWSTTARATRWSTTARATRCRCRLPSLLQAVLPVFRREDAPRVKPLTAPCCCADSPRGRRRISTTPWRRSGTRS
jgi:hypothetical protein